MHSARRRPALLRGIAMTSALAVICGVHAGGVVAIHEGGPTVPIGHFLAAFMPDEPASQPDAIVPPATTDLPVTFPITTESMRPGRLRQPVQLRTAGWLSAPMFIVGDDPLSRQWLAANGQRLQRSGASGLVVNVASLDAFRSLRALLPDVPMAAGSIDELARDARLSVYPLFVAIDGRATQVVP